MINKRIILASGSPRRRELLSMLGFDFEVHVSEADERTDRTDPVDVVKFLSSIKARAVYDDIIKGRGASEDAIIIGADTIVSIDNEILGKPKNEKLAFEMLKNLQGRSHQVYTGVTLINTHKDDDAKIDIRSFVCRTNVIVNPMSDEQIKEYIATGDSLDKAGGYGIQGIFSRHVKGIEGDYFNVVGLPVSMLYDEIRVLLKINN